MRALLYSALLLAGLVRAQTADSERAFERALELHKSGDFATAIEQYQACLKADPRKIEARSNLGAALVRVGRYSEAIEQYRTALEGAPPPMQAPLRLNLALAYYKTGEIAHAAGELDTVRAAAPGNLQATLLLADCRLRMGEFAKVIELLRPIQMTTDMDASTALAIRYMLGTALIRSGQVQEGQTVVEAILRNAGSAEAGLLVGMSMFMAGDYPGAVGQFRRAAEANPEMPSVFSYYGQALLYTGDADGAQDAFRKALRQDGNDFDANLRLGQILEARQRHAEALPLLERALMTRPASVEAHQDLATVYAKLGRSADAERESAIVQQAGPRAAPAVSPVGPAVGREAPGFELKAVGSEATVRLADLRKSRPVLLVFGSYTCPKLRASAPALEDLYARHGKQVGFLLVYIHEAHAAGSWQSTINEREGVALVEARTAAEKEQHATLCRRALKFEFPAAIDGLDNRVESLYAAWPSRAYLVGVDGKVLWSSALGELDFQPAEADAAIRAALGGPR